MKELMLVVGMVVAMFVARIVFAWEATIYTLLWQGFATLFALAWQQASYKNTRQEAVRD